MGMERGGGRVQSWGGKRPAGRAEPCAQHMMALAQRHRWIDAMGGADLRLAAGDIPAAVGVVPGRYAMPPPELPADAPILDIVHPIAIQRRPMIGYEAVEYVLHGAVGRLRQRLHTDTPWVGEVM